MLFLLACEIVSVNARQPCRLKRAVLTMRYCPAPRMGTLFFCAVLTLASVSVIVDISESDISEAVIERVIYLAETGALTEAVYYILLSLLAPMHGYGIMQNIEALSGGRVRLAAGTLYGALNTMLERGWIYALPGERDSRKKEYHITDLGKEALHGEVMRLIELLENGRRVLGGLGQ